MQYTNLFSRSLLTAANLSPESTTGGSELGTLDAPTYPVSLNDTQFTRDGVVLTAATNNPYLEPLPNGTDRPYYLTLSRKSIAPDGQEKPCILINGTFPGPTLEANYGDTFIITVKNLIEGPEEGTSLHWHGLLQNGTQMYDGVPAADQCPIAPGEEFTYIFRASLYGTSWYHSHYSAQYADGALGAMIIYGFFDPSRNVTTLANDSRPNFTSEATYDIDTGPVILSDWYHVNSYFDIVTQQETNNPVPTGIPVPDNNLINGRMFFDCPAKPEQREYEELPPSPPTLACNQDNKLRALERFASQASTFCPTYIAATTPAPLPTYVSKFNAADVSSACECFEASATKSNVVITLPTSAPTPTSTSPPYTIPPLTLPCTPNASISTFNFTSGKIHRLRLINAGAEALQRFGHRGMIRLQANFSLDFVPVVPYNTSVVTLGTGQRADVLVYANGSSTESFFMRSEISKKCVGANNSLALAAIFYEDADRTIPPPDNPTYYDDNLLKCGNDDLNVTAPLYPYGKPHKPTTTEVIEIEFGNNGTNILPGQRYGTNGSLQWFMNNSTFHANYDHPILNLTYNGNTSYPDDPQWNVYNFGSNDTVRLILRNHIANDHASHPMHLHGHNFLVLAEGFGDWDGNIVNPDNPQRRDTQILTQAYNVSHPNIIPQPVYTGYENEFVVPSFTVIQFDQDNPGIWPLHCHRAWHVSSGLYITVMERPADITNSSIPEIMGQTCRAWDRYDDYVVVNQIDSGE
ncbi:hypothetical protein ACLMJK_006336 [Lecanora helva]